MKTTKKQLVNFAIGLVKEISKSNKDISVDCRNTHINIWFYKDNTAELISIWSHISLRKNKQEFKKAILKIRGIVLWKENY